MLGNILRSTTNVVTRGVARPAIAPRSVIMPSTSRLYHERVMDHYQNPRNVSELAS